MLEEQQLAETEVLAVEDHGQLPQVQELLVKEIMVAQVFLQAALLQAVVAVEQVPLAKMAVQQEHRKADQEVMVLLG